MRAMDVMDVMDMMDVMAVMAVISARRTRGFQGRKERKEIRNIYRGDNAKNPLATKKTRPVGPITASHDYQHGPCSIIKIYLIALLALLRKCTTIYRGCTLLELISADMD